MFLDGGRATMSSKKPRVDHFANARRITLLGLPSIHRCQFCESRGKTCFIDPLEMPGKCAECVRRKRACVPVTLETLDAIGDKLADDLARDRKEWQRLFEAMGQLQARIARNERLQQENNRQSSEKFDCVARELEESGDLEPPGSEGVDWSFLRSSPTPAAGESLLPFEREVRYPAEIVEVVSRPIVPDAVPSLVGRGVPDVVFYLLPCLSEVAQRFPRAFFLGIPFPLD